MAIGSGGAGLSIYVGFEIINSLNFGNVTATHDDEGYSAGIAANASNTTFVNCANYGDIICSQFGAGVCGIPGSYPGDENLLLVVKNCFNVGDIIVTPAINSSSGNKATSAGILGYSKYTSVLLQNSYNCGSVQASYAAGGFVGARDNGTFSFIVDNCYNLDNALFGQTFSNTTVTNTGLINADGTFPNSTPYPDLLTALNAWVDANKATYPELKNWVMGDNGYPTFAD